MKNLFMLSVLLIPILGFSSVNPEKINWSYEIYQVDEKEMICSKALVLGSPSNSAALSQAEPVAVQLRDVTCKVGEAKASNESKDFTKSFFCFSNKNVKKNIVSTNLLCGENKIKNLVNFKVYDKSCSSKDNKSGKCSLGIKVRFMCEVVK